MSCRAGKAGPTCVWPGLVSELSGRGPTLKETRTFLYGVVYSDRAVDRDHYRNTIFGAVRSIGGPAGYVAYFPTPIPRQIDISEANLLLLADAEAALGRLAGAGRLLPDPHLLVRPYLRRECERPRRP